MVYFKHRQPDALCTLGPENYRASVWRIAEELEIRMTGARPGSGGCNAPSPPNLKRKNEVLVWHCLSIP